MQTEEILSAGIDIGTSTTQLIFSRMVLKNTGGFGKIPQIKVISREIIYRSPVYFTPLSSEEKIDGKKVYQIIQQEFDKAGIQPEDLATGAVIITGESSRKKNAKEVLSEISAAAGDFVVAAAGADLESVLAGKGSGAAKISAEQHRIVANLDIGGGTTNICVFDNGEIADMACLDIGGRLIRLSEDGIVTYIAPKIGELLKCLQIPVEKGKKAELNDLIKLTDFMAELLAQSVGLTPKSGELDFICTNRLLTTDKQPDLFTFSGGVSDCMGREEEAVFRYGDIGVLLAHSIKNHPAFKKASQAEALETMRATVIGAGNYSMNISGSTIEYNEKSFPLKNVPVVKVRLKEAADIPFLAENIRRGIRMYREQEETNVQIALAMEGIPCPHFADMQQIGQILAETLSAELGPDNRIIVIFEQDIAKAAGQAVRRFDRQKHTIICIDGIHCENGDFVDFGEPKASGKVIPVVVKTLIFNG